MLSCRIRQVQESVLKTFRRFLDPHFTPTNEGLKIVKMSSNFYQGTTTIHTTLQVSQSLLDLVVAQISARNEISIQSLLKIRSRNDVSGYLTYFEAGPPVRKVASCCNPLRKAELSSTLCNALQCNRAFTVENK